MDNRARLVQVTLLALASLVPAGNELNNREWASLFWLTVILLALIRWNETRGIILGVIPTVTAFWQVWLVFAALLVWTAFLVMIAYRFHLWSTAFIKDTLIWCGPSAIVLFFSVNQVTRQPHFFGRAALAAFKVSVFIDFYVNLYVFPFLFEMVLQPVVAVLALIPVVATDRRVKALVNGLLSVLGLAIIVFATVKLFRTGSKPIGRTSSAGSFCPSG